MIRNSITELLLGSTFGETRDNSPSKFCIIPIADMQVSSNEQKIPLMPQWGSGWDVFKQRNVDPSFKVVPAMQTSQVHKKSKNFF